MTTRSRKVVVAIGWFVILWPIAQIVLVEVARTNPWRLMGFAMYTTDHQVRVTLKTQNVTVEPRDLPREAREAYDDFLVRRAVLGRLCSPTSFVSTWRRIDPRVGEVEVDIEVLRLKDARMTTIARDRLAL